MGNSVAVNRDYVNGVTVVRNAQIAKMFGGTDAAEGKTMQGSMYFTLNSPEYYLYNIAYCTYNVPLSFDWRWLLAYHEQLASGATPDAAYDYADTVANLVAAGAPLNMAQAQADVDLHGIRYATPWEDEVQP